MGHRLGSTRGWAWPLRGLWLFVLLLTGFGPALAAPQPADPARPTVVIGFSNRSLGQANRTDLKAAMRAWMQTLARERHLELNADIRVFESLAETERALRLAEVDVISVPIDEFVVLEKLQPLAGFFASQAQGKATDRYVLLVRKDRPRKDLASLREASIVILDEPRSLLAPLWLDTELLRRRLPAGSRHFGKLTHAVKPSLAIMALFFKQADAVLATQSGFDTACELNPQLGKELSILLSSPELVSTVSAYRADATSASVTLYQRESLKLGETPAGKLILTLFRAEAIVELKESDLRETRALLAEHARLLAGVRRQDGNP
jgi:phosphonate transport system substrate-binding protein